ncbi:PREDICTED: thymocyte nuclear protein 1 isoform X2 [Chinchilla lanigera]|uniref:thymocyte nuclear protein 1 isoform X2 n=1 Tax=Chinchilla lanigera TaxID=34839 RepID=UPI00069627C0|nr:PREDICTED: thymocyte nuclear protein 1 isoform X2 [Chinchilla lanigera]
MPQKPWSAPPRGTLGAPTPRHSGSRLSPILRPRRGPPRGVRTTAPRDARAAPQTRLRGASACAPAPEPGARRLVGETGVLRTADKKELSGKHIKTENSNETSAHVENSSPETVSDSKNCGKNLSNYWLMKSEPESRLEKGVDVKFSIEDLKAQPEQTACWDGVRNYQIVKEAYPDHTQFEKNNPYYDPSSKKDNPKWFMVDVQFIRIMKRFISLAELKTYHQAHKASGGPLKNMALFTRQRLSVQSLTQEEFDFILSLEEKEPS